MSPHPLQTELEADSSQRPTLVSSIISEQLAPGPREEEGIEPKMSRGGLEAPWKCPRTLNMGPLFSPRTQCHVRSCLRQEKRGSAHTTLPSCALLQDVFVSIRFGFRSPISVDPFRCVLVVQRRSVWGRQVFCKEGHYPLDLAL